jgi:ABC-type molybdate transport system permease subunit
MARFRSVLLTTLLLTLTVAKPNTLMSSGFTVLMNVFLARKEFFTSRSTVCPSAVAVPVRPSEKNPP